MTVSCLPIKFLFLLITYIDTCQWSPNQCGCPHIEPSINNRIVGGSEAIPHSWPWMVSLRKYGMHICGGSLISTQHVLTAAHCFKNYDPSSMMYFSFVIGHHGITEENIVMKAKRIIIHESYNTNGRTNNDIAIIELDQIVDFSNNKLGFVCLPVDHVMQAENYPPVGTTAWVVGWGAVVFKGPSSTTLLQVGVPITNSDGCMKKVTDSVKQVCAGYDEGSKDSCQGDSGGPLVIDNDQGIFEIIGIVSFGEGCASPGKPGIYTRVTAYLDWIDSVIDMRQIPSLDDVSAMNNTLNNLTINYRQISYVLILIEFLFLI